MVYRCVVSKLLVVGTNFDILVYPSHPILKRDSLQVRTWPELNAFLDEIAQKRFDPIPRSILSILLISVTQIAGAQSWQPQMAMARSVLGFPKPANAEFGHEISRFMSHFQKMVRQNPPVMENLLYNKDMV